MLRHLITATCVAGLGAAAHAQTLMVVESTNDTVMLIDGFDGTLLQSNFIDLSVAGASTPIEALVVGNEIWVTDQLLDGVMRFSLDGTTHLGNITGGMDNVRGFEVVGTTAFLANSGTSGGAPGDTLVTVDTTTAMVTGNFPVGDPFDVLAYNGNLLVANIAGEDIDIYDYAGNFLGKFHDSDGITGIDFPEQISLGNGGNVLAAGFSAPSGVFEYDSTGAQINYYDTGAIAGHTGLRGVWQLGNGNILYTGGSGLYILDPVNLTSTPVVTGVSGRFISALADPVIVEYCNGDGSGTLCPCGNHNDGTNGVAGCANSAGAGGGKLAATGSNSIGAGDLVLSGSTLQTGQAGLYLQGNNATGGGSGTAFGDGLRCAGGGVVRLQIRNSGMTGSSFTTVDIAATGGVAPGDVKRYQLWFRDTAGPCGSGFNFTNGLEITWAP